jgi:type IV secretory pathway VirB10-like protein
MKKRSYILAVALALAALAISGCHRGVVRAATPSVASKRTIGPMPQPVPADRTETASEPAPEPFPPVAPEPANLPSPVPARPAPAEPARPRTEPEPPQISPQLSPQDQADAMRHTNDDIRTAEKNLQRANGKKLDASQTDLVGKVQGFLSQAHEAILANDWVRARNLALKAQVLSAELVKSL